MKAVIYYLSTHHGNTRRVVEAMAGACPAELVDLSAPVRVFAQDFDLIGFASGIYGFAFHPTVVSFAREHLPEGKRVFFVCTYGGLKGTGAREIARIARERRATVLGEFGCRGFNTFGPFKWFGGSGKGLPSEADLAQAQAFFRDLCGRC